MISNRELNHIIASAKLGSRNANDHAIKAATEVSGRVASKLGAPQRALPAITEAFHHSLALKVVVDTARTPEDLAGVARYSRAFIEAIRQAEGRGFKLNDELQGGMEATGELSQKVLRGISLSASERKRFFVLAKALADIPFAMNVIRNVPAGKEAVLSGVLRKAVPLIFNRTHMQWHAEKN